MRGKEIKPTLASQRRCWIEEGSGDASALPTVYLTRLFRASQLPDPLREGKGLRNEVCGGLKGEKTGVNEQVIKFGLRAGRAIVVAQIILGLAVAALNIIDSLGARQVKMRTDVFDTPGQGRKNVNV